MLIIANLFSKYMAVVRMRGLTDESLNSAVEQGWVYGNCIRMFHSDQGKYVDGRKVRDLCTECGINTNIRSTVWHYATRLARGVGAGSTTWQYAWL